MSEETYYLALGVAETATGDEIKSAYRSLLKKIHPDTVSTLSEETRSRAEEATRYLNEAYSVLSDQGQRAEYDYVLAEQRKARAAAAGNASAESADTKSSNSGGIGSEQPLVTPNRRRRRRRHRSHRRRHSSSSGSVKSLFRPVSMTDWLVLFGYVFLAIVLVVIAIVIVSSAPEASEDSAVQLINQGSKTFSVVKRAPLVALQSLEVSHTFLATEVSQASGLITECG